MHFDLRRPCATCPFLRGTSMRLRPSRIKQLDRDIARHNGAVFPCHKTVDYTQSDHDDQVFEGTQHCAGALLYALNHDCSSQLARIMARLGLFDPDRLEGAELVWTDVDEWLINGSDR